MARHRYCASVETRRAGYELARSAFAQLRSDVISGSEPKSRPRRVAMESPRLLAALAVAIALITRLTPAAIVQRWRIQVARFSSANKTKKKIATSRLVS